MLTKVEGDLIIMALSGEFDVIAHGCNCFCKMTAGIAVPMSNTFGCHEFDMEKAHHKGKYNKLGTIDKSKVGIRNGVVFPAASVGKDLYVVNCYTQYNYGANHKDGSEDPFDPIAIVMCLKKLNHEFAGKTIGLPYIGCGLASPAPLRPSRRQWFEHQIEAHMSDCQVILVSYPDGK